MRATTGCSPVETPKAGRTQTVGWDQNSARFSRGDLVRTRHALAAPRRNVEIVIEGDPYSKNVAFSHLQAIICHIGNGPMPVVENVDELRGIETECAYSATVGSRHHRYSSGPQSIIEDGPATQNIKWLEKQVRRQGSVVEPWYGGGGLILPLQGRQ